MEKNHNINVIFYRITPADDYELYKKKSYH
jgi:hypothetical protein